MQWLLYISLALALVIFLAVRFLPGILRRGAEAETVEQVPLQARELARGLDGLQVVVTTAMSENSKMIGFRCLGTGASTSYNIEPDHSFNERYRSYLLGDTLRLRSVEHPLRDTKVEIADDRVRTRASLQIMYYIDAERLSTGQS